MAARQAQLQARRKSSAAFAVLLLAGGCSDQHKEPRVAVENGWTREMAPRQRAAAVYLTISNEGDAADRLVAASSAAAAASMHSSSIEDGVARMRPIDDGLEIPARSRVDLEPGGTHIMVTGLGKPLKAGEALHLTLEFERSGRRQTAVRVVPANGAQGHPQHRTGM